MKRFQSQVTIPIEWNVSEGQTLVSTSVGSYRAHISKGVLTIYREFELVSQEKCGTRLEGIRLATKRIAAWLDGTS